jgi:hypothetical protein
MAEGTASEEFEGHFVHSFGLNLLQSTQEPWHFVHLNSRPDN